MSDNHRHYKEFSPFSGVFSPLAPLAELHYFLTIRYPLAPTQRKARKPAQA